MLYQHNYFLDTDILSQLSKHSGKPVIYMRADGPLSLTDSEELQEVWEFYIGKCDLNILNCLRQFGHAYCYFETDDQAWDAFNEWFPNKNELLDEEMKYYVYQNLISFHSDINVVNG
jgi:hypothetical protein